MLRKKKNKPTSSFFFKVIRILFARDVLQMMLEDNTLENPQYPSMSSPRLCKISATWNRKFCTILWLMDPEVLFSGTIPESHNNKIQSLLWGWERSISIYFTTAYCNFDLSRGVCHLDNVPKNFVWPLVATRTASIRENWAKYSSIQHFTHWETCWQMLL